MKFDMSWCVQILLRANITCSPLKFPLLSQTFAISCMIRCTIMEDDTISDVVACEDSRSLVVSATRLNVSINELQIREIQGG